MSFSVGVCEKFCDLFLSCFFKAIKDYETAQANSENDQQIREGLERAQRMLKQSQKRDYYKILGVKRWGVNIWEADVTVGYYTSLSGADGLPLFCCSLAFVSLLSFCTIWAVLSTSVAFVKNSSRKKEKVTTDGKEGNESFGKKSFVQMIVWWMNWEENKDWKELMKAIKKIKLWQILQ